MARIIIRTRKYETRKQAEWRYFLAAMLDNKYDPKDVLATMKDTDTIEDAKRWLNGPTEVQKKQSKARQRYINTSKEIEKEIEFMTSQPGFTTNDGYKIIR